MWYNFQKKDKYYIIAYNILDIFRTQYLRHIYERFCKDIDITIACLLAQDVKPVTLVRLSAIWTLVLRSIYGRIKCLAPSRKSTMPRKS